MARPLRILVVEDSPSDAGLIVRHIERAGYEVSWERVDDAAALQAVLNREPWDVVVADYTMPGFSGHQALGIVAASALDVPFIFVSGTMGEDVVVAAMKAGAHDYVTKGALTRLVPAIEREMREAQGRRQKRQVEQSLALRTRALEAAAHAVVIVQRDGHIEWVNPAFTVLTGYSAEEAVGQTTRLLKSGRHPPGFYADLWQTVLAGRVWHGELTNRRKDGTFYPEEQTITPVRGPDGEITHFIAIKQDITERKRVEAELREAYDETQRLLAHSPAVLYRLRLQGHEVVPVMVSDNVTRLLGFSVAETLSYAWWYDHLHPEDRDAAMATVPDTLKRGTSRAEYRLRTKSGDYRWVEDNRQLVPDASGQATEFVGVWTDISERKNAERDLRQSEAHFRSLIENSSDVIGVVGPDQTVRYVSPSVERVLGHAPSALLGRNVLDQVHPEDQELAREALARVMQGSHACTSTLVRIQHRDGAWRQMQAMSQAQRSPSGEVTVVVNARDVTEQRDLERQFLRSQKMEVVGRLAGGVAHDFNNILTVITGFCELTLATLDPGHPCRADIQEVLDAGRRAATLTRQLLAFSRKEITQPSTFVLDELIIELRKMLNRLVEENITIVFPPEASPRRVTADPGQIEQVLVNLVLNARDAMPHGGKITVETSETVVDEAYARVHPDVTPGPYVVLRVSDTGTGMSDDVKAHLFEPFFTTKEAGIGTGLGLTTVHGIVKRAGGTIDVESAPGSGTTFRILLPRGGDAPVAKPRTATDLRHPRSQTVLVVEDQEVLLRLARTVLEGEGYTVLTALHGPDALRLAASHAGRIDLLLTDIVMRMMSGAELARILGREHPEMRVLFMSGYTELGIRDLGDNASFLQKPFPLEGLRAKVRDALDTEVNGAA